MYIYTHIYIYTYIHIHIHIYTHIYIHTYIHTNIHTYMYLLCATLYTVVIALPVSLKFRQLFLVFGKCGVTPLRLYRDSLTLRRPKQIRVKLHGSNEKHSLPARSGASWELDEKKN